MGGVRGTGDVMRDARQPVRKKMEGMDGGALLVCPPLELRRLRTEKR